MKQSLQGSCKQLQFFFHLMTSKNELLSLTEKKNHWKWAIYYCSKVLNKLPSDLFIPLFILRGFLLFSMSFEAMSAYSSAKRLKYFLQRQQKETNCFTENRIREFSAIVKAKSSVF